MYYTIRDVVDAIITAGARRGSDGRGKDGLDGLMFMLARTDRASFGSLLAAALRLNMKAKPERWAARKESLTDEEIKAEFRERGLPEELIQYLPKYDPNNPPAARRKYAQPNGTRELMEAIINAAIRHGSDGHGKDGLVGYMLGCKSISSTSARVARSMRLLPPLHAIAPMPSSSRPTHSSLPAACKLPPWRRATGFRRLIRTVLMS
jgi:hypothetical protein